MINLKDKLSHLTFRQACKLLGPQGGKLIRQGGKYDIDIHERVSLNKDFFRLDLGDTLVIIRLDPFKNQKLYFECTACRTACEHLGAAFSLILEEQESEHSAGASRRSVPTRPASAT